MARIGVNPARGKTSDYHPAQVTVAVLTYIPDLSGYFEERLQILKLVLASLRANTSVPYDLIVFDNHSCEQVVAYLREQQRAGFIDYLFLSGQNIGKIGALRILFEAVPGEIVAYSDDDILFYPGWLEAHLEILKAFPKAGMVSGVPLRNAAGHARRSLEALTSASAPGLTILHERRIPDEWERDWAISTGRDPDKYPAETRDQMDLVLRSQASGGEIVCEAIGSANHFQFVAPKRLILQALPDEWSGKLMGHMIELDEAIDNLGYLRLSTTNRYTRHLGNKLDPKILDEVASMGLIEGDADTTEFGKPIPDRQAGRQSHSRNRHWSLRIPGMRRIYTAIYRRLFDVLYQ
jgi:hypothetical protein